MSELTDLLMRWEEGMRLLGAPTRDFLAPGADPARVRQVLSAAGFAVPQEVVDWFTWHDGASVTSDVFWLAPLSILPLSLDETLSSYQEWRQFAISTSEGMIGEGIPQRENPDFYWEHTWLPIGSDIANRGMALDLNTDQDHCTLHLIDAWATGEDSFRDVRAPSLTTAVRQWISWLDLGYWSWAADATGQPRWQNDFAGLPLEIRISGML